MTSGLAGRGEEVVVDTQGEDDKKDELSKSAKRQRQALVDSWEDLADSWTEEGLFRYRFRGRLWLLSDPRGCLVRGTGTSMWSAGEVLVDYLAEHPEIYRRAACLDLGAGLGAAGLTMAACGARFTLLTDVPRQLPLLERNAEENFPGGEVVQVRPLDWVCEEQRTGLAPWNRKWSVIVGSDLGYDQALFEPLLETLVAQCTEATSVYLALADREEDDEPNVQDFVEAASSRFAIREVHARRLEPFQSVTKVLLLKLRPAASAARGLQQAG
eukprot:CAMPEP_0179141808 /NCGR_PEP_ID=MMETSP0796-20121207/68057_1 /TAXON_ID=73915 /ORGANISM="Pyrodinium bahamense, Strain pbaha01" /LENGTH=270 /DNA_ID=CAMNT_0020841603 /DNA_START=30 /DNA_END=842 /DNA_ORIENTATION=+